MKKKIFPVFLVGIFFLISCSSGLGSSLGNGSTTTSWEEDAVKFSFGDETLVGVLTLPRTSGPYPAVVLVSGSVSPVSGQRSGISDSYFIDHARAMARDGYAVLRYDPPGIGESGGEAGVESLESRVEEAMAAHRYLQSRPDIQHNRVGMWGVSQGAWVIALAAAEYPDEVAFIISISGAGVSVAEQQVYSIKAQSKAAGFSEEDISKAALVGRLLIDWQLESPVYENENREVTMQLGSGPWDDFMDLVYQPGDLTPAEGLAEGIRVMKIIQQETWARYLYLDTVYIPQLESVPPEQAAQVKAIMGPTLLSDPADYLVRVTVPVLAVFGEGDVLQPTEISASLFKQYLEQAGNENYTIVVIPSTGHTIYLSIPEYRKALTSWLEALNE